MDGHDVDEDNVSICDCGGMWFDGSWAGITLRSVIDAPTTAASGVASRLIYLS